MGACTHKGLWLPAIQRGRRMARRIGITMLVASFAAISASTAASSTANTTVTVTVLSATNLDATGCATGTANVTDFGIVFPGSSSVTSLDCNLIWGSSNDSAMLRTYQQDQYGKALWSYSNGTPDNSFDADGKLFTNVLGTDGAYDVEVAPGGNVLVAGRADTDFALVQYLVTGAVDVAFDGDTGVANGKVTTDFGGTDIAYGMARGTDGTIVLAGQSGNDIAVAKYLADGRLDTSFSTDGKLTTDVGGAVDRANSVAIQTDGKIVVVGNSGADCVFARYTPAGLLDPTFDGPGVAGDGVFKINLTGTDTCDAVTIQPDGKILTVGTAGTSPTTVSAIRLNPTDGSYDLSFDGTSGTGNGKVTFSVGPGDDDGKGVALQSDGKIMVAATALDVAADKPSITRLSSIGAVDNTYGTSGSTIVSVGTWAYVTDVVVQQIDDKAVISGFSDIAGNDNLLLARFTTSGALDQTFDADGMVMTDVNGGWNDEARALTLAEDGTIVAAGWYENANDIAVAKYGSVKVANYANGVDDWDTTAPNDTQFGACLRAVSGSGVSGAWTVNATCPTTDGGYWNPIPTTNGSAGSKIAASPTSGVNSATASLRFGFRTATTQAPGVYLSPLVFEIVAPNV